MVRRRDPIGDVRFARIDARSYRPRASKIDALSVT